MFVDSSRFPLGAVVEEEWEEFRGRRGGLGKENSLQQPASSFISVLLPEREQSGEDNGQAFSFVFTLVGRS